MRAILTNNYLYVQEATPEEEDLVSNALKVKVPGAVFTQSFKKKHWDGTKKFYDKRTKKCEAGFLERLYELAEEKDFLLEVEDGRRELKSKKVMSYKKWHAFLDSIGIKANAYQCKVQVRAARAGLHTYIKDSIPWYRGIFEIATGGGKTSLAGLILKTLNKKRAIFMLARIDLMYQTKEVLEAILQEPVGIVGDTERDYRRVTMVMAQTAGRLIKEEVDKKGKVIKEADPEFIDHLKKTKVLILDEAHHLQEGSTYDDVNNLCANAFFRYALTATPLRRYDPGDAQLIGSYGNPIVSVKSKTLRDRGVLAEVKTWVIENNGPVEVGTRANKNLVKSLGIHENYYRHELVVQAAERFREAKWPCLILVDSPLKHGIALQEQFASMGCGDVPLINYKTPKHERRDILRMLESGRLPYIIASTGVFGEGIDAPLIRGLIRAEGGSSSIRTLQAAGRGMRRKPHPNVLYMVDIWDKANKVLELDSRKRIQIYQEEEYDIFEIENAEQIQFPED